MLNRHRCSAAMSDYTSSLCSLVQSALDYHLSQTLVGFAASVRAKQLIVVLSHSVQSMTQPM